MTLKAWDSDYSRRGRLWGGSVRGLPKLPEGAAVLELGCGDGKTLSAMPSCWNTLAMDISLQALRLCRRALPGENLILADARRLPFPEEIFDAVFAYHVTGHLLIREREALAREAERVLSRGGRLFFREFGRDDMRMGEGREVEEGTFLRGAGTTTHYFTEREVQELFFALRPVSIETKLWKMRIKGRDSVRSLVEAVFLKG